MLTDNAEVNRVLYQCAKNALYHRSGTLFEDMYWISLNNGKILLSVEDSDVEQGILYSNKIKQFLEHNKEPVITLHTHPGSNPPSLEDFNSCYHNNYELGVVACHDGKVFVYNAFYTVSNNLYNLYANQFSYLENEFELQLAVLNELSANHFIWFKEVLV